VPEHVGSHERTEGLLVEPVEGRPAGWFRLVGDLDAATADDLLAAGRAAVADGAEELVLGCAELRFSDSAGLRALLLLQREAQVVLDQPQEQLTRLLRLVGVDTLRIT
jgi:anti-anti-sigma factor